jgi:hypothetical protein
MYRSVASRGKRNRRRPIERQLIELIVLPVRACYSECSTLDGLECSGSVPMACREIREGVSAQYFFAEVGSLDI